MNLSNVLPEDVIAHDRAAHPKAEEKLHHIMRTPPAKRLVIRGQPFFYYPQKTAGGSP